MDKDISLQKHTISVIIPVYNVEKYLTRCLDSIFTQEFAGQVEVIAVDDCSTDNSLHVLKEYKKKNEALIIIEHTENRKLSCARASGIQVATGDYIIHVDSDDWLLPDSLQELCNAIAEKDVDVVVYNYLRENPAGQQTRINEIKEDLFTTDKRKVAKHFLGACWNKIVKRELINNLVYGNVGINSEEDLIYCVEILNKSNSFYLTQKTYYAYFDNSTSITSVVKPTGFLNSQPLVLGQLGAIFTKYETNLSIKNFVLDYFEKWVLLSVARIQFLFASDTAFCSIIVNQIADINVMSKKRLKKIKLAVKYKLLNAAFVYYYFGARVMLSVLLKSIKR